MRVKPDIPPDHVDLKSGWSIRPISFNEAKKVLSTHRHLLPPNGWLFAVALYDPIISIRGVGCCSRPNARALQDGLTCEINRIATDGCYNGCSILYSRLLTAAKALGYLRVVTYTRVDEPGTSPKSAGFVYDGLSRDGKGGEWSCPSRPRRLADDPSGKVRWIWQDKSYVEQVADRRTGVVDFGEVHRRG